MIKHGLRTTWNIKHTRNGTVLNTQKIENVVTDEGNNYALKACFNGFTPISSWYVGLFDNFEVTPSTYDAYATSTIITNEFEDYSETTRPALVLPANSAITGTSANNIGNEAIFTCTNTTSANVFGAFLCGGGTDSNVKGDNEEEDAVLYAAVKFATYLTCISGDELSMTITISPA